MDSGKISEHVTVELATRPAASHERWREYVDRIREFLARPLRDVLEEAKDVPTHVAAQQRLQNEKLQAEKELLQAKAERERSETLSQRRRADAEIELMQAQAEAQLLEVRLALRQAGYEIKVRAYDPARSMQIEIGPIDDE